MEVGTEREAKRRERKGSDMYRYRYLCRNHIFWSVCFAKKAILYVHIVSFLSFFLCFH